MNADGGKEGARGFCAATRRETEMALRPLAFGARFVDKGRTVRVKAKSKDSKRYVVEVSRAGQKTCRRDHASLGGAVKDFASAWRGRLN